MVGPNQTINNARYLVTKMERRVRKRSELPGILVQRKILNLL